MTAPVATVSVEFIAEIARLISGVQQASRVVGEHMESIKKSAEIAKNALELLGVTVGVGAFVEGIKRTIEYADTLEHLSQRVGISVKDLAGFSLAAEENGTTLEAVATSVKKLSTFMVAHDQVLQSAGVTSKNASGALLQLADIFHAMPDGVEKTALAVQLFGKNGIEMIPVMNQGSEALKEQRLKSEALAEQYERLAPNAKLLKEQTTELGMASQIASAQIASALMPQLIEITKAMALAAQEGGALKGVIVGIGGVMDEMFVAPFERMGLQIKARLAEFDAFIQHIKGDHSAEAATRQHLSEIYKEIIAAAGPDSANAPAFTAPATMTQDEALASALRILHAQQEAAAAAKVQSTYDNLVKTLKEKIAVDQAQLKTDVPLTEAQKSIIKMHTDLNAILGQLTPKQRAYVESLIDQYTVENQLLDAHTLTLKMAEDLGKAADQDIDNLQRQIDAQQLHNDEIGKTKEQIDLVRQAAEDAEIAQKQADAEAIADAIKRGEVTGNALVIYEAYLGKLQQEIPLLQQRAALFQQGAALEKANEATRLLQEDFKQFANTAGNDLENALFNGGTRGGKSLIQQLQSDFAHAAFHVVIQAAVNGQLGSLASAASGGNILSEAGNAGSLFNSASNLLGLSSLPGLGTAVSNLSTIIPTFSTMVEGGAGVVDAASAALAGTASSFAALVPWVGGALAIYSLLSSGGGEDPHNNPDSKYIVGHFGINGAQPAGGNLANITMGQTSGQGRWADYSALSQDQLTQLNQGTAAVFAAGQSLAKILGVDASALNDVAVEGERFSGVSDVVGQLWTNVATKLLPTIGQFAQTGETVQQTLVRVTGDIQGMDAATRQLGIALNLTGTASQRAQTVENIVGAGGGSQAFFTNLQAYYQAFYSDAERAASAQQDLVAQFHALGVELPANKAGFRDLVKGLDLTTASGQALFAQLITLAPAFATAADAAQTAADAAIANAQAAQQADDDLAAATAGYTKTGMDALAKAYQDQLSSLTGAQSQWTTLAKSLHDTITNLNASDLSPLAGADKYNALRDQFNQAAAAAQGGDQAAAASLPALAQQFLQESRLFNSSSAAYSADFGTVQAALAQVAGSADHQADALGQQIAIAQSQLDALNAISGALSGFDKSIVALLAGEAPGTGAGGQMSDIQTLAKMQADSDNYYKTTTMGQVTDYSQGVAGSYFVRGAGNTTTFHEANGTVFTLHETDALTDIAKAHPEIAAAWAQQYGLMLPGHAAGLARVPYDDYLMRAHRDEAVLSASQADAWRSGQGGVSGEDLAALREEIRGVGMRIDTLIGVVHEGDVDNVRATEKVAKARDEAAWKKQIEPKLN